MTHTGIPAPTGGPSGLAHLATSALMRKASATRTHLAIKPASVSFSRRKKSADPEPLDPQGGVGLIDGDGSGARRNCQLPEDAGADRRAIGGGGENKGRMILISALTGLCYNWGQLWDAV